MSLEVDDGFEQFPHKELTREIIGAAFEVHNGFLERVYQRALQVELIRRGFSAEIEKRIQVTYKGAVVGDYDADLVVDDAVLIEIKIAPQYDKRDEAQLPERAEGDWTEAGITVEFRPLQDGIPPFHLLICVSSVSICG